MGLAVALAAEYDADDAKAWLDRALGGLDAPLRGAGVEPWREPDEYGPIGRSRAMCTSFPYSFLHYLRRVYARVKQDPAWKATPCEGDPTQDAAVERESYMFEDHLLCHSDCEGFYLPVDFREPVFGDTVLGGIVGSSVRLFDEVCACAPALGIELVDGVLSDAEAARVNDLAVEGELEREHTVWIALYEAARLSIAHRTAIVFT